LADSTHVYPLQSVSSNGGSPQLDADFGGRPVDNMYRSIRRRAPIFL